MTTFVCVKKSPVPDDILDGLINDNKIYDGPLGNFYKACQASVTSIKNTNIALRDKLNTALSNKNLDELRAILSATPKSVTDSLDEICSDDIETYESELEKVATLDGVTVISSTPSTIKIHVKSLRIVYKDTTKSEFWELKPENVELTIYIATTNEKASISKIYSSYAHPYADTDKFIRLTSPISIGKSVLYNTISFAINYLKMFKPEFRKRDLSNYIGKKCAISGVYTYGTGINCAKTGEHVAREEAIYLNGIYYSPKIVKTCSKCAKQSVEWTSQNKVIVCGVCNDNT